MSLMNVVPLILYTVSLVNTLPIISKPLDNSPDHLLWEALLTHREDDKTRKIPKSIFITPNLNDSKGNCPQDHKLGPDGKCYKTLNIDPLVILKTQIDSLFRNRTTVTEYDDDYDYEYGDSTESISTSANSEYTVPLSLGFASDRLQEAQKQQQKQPAVFPYLNRVVKDDAHIKLGINMDDEKSKKPFLVSANNNDDHNHHHNSHHHHHHNNNNNNKTTDGIDLDAKSNGLQNETKASASTTQSSVSPTTTPVAPTKSANKIDATSEAELNNTTTTVKSVISTTADAIISTQKPEIVSDHSLANDVTSSSKDAISSLPPSTDHTTVESETVPNDDKVTRELAETIESQGTVTEVLPLVVTKPSSISIENNSTTNQTNFELTSNTETTENSTDVTNQTSDDIIDVEATGSGNYSEKIEEEVEIPVLSQVVSEIQKALLDFNENSTEAIDSTEETSPTEVNNNDASSTQHMEMPVKTTTAESTSSAVPQTENPTSQQQIDSSTTKVDRMPLTAPYEVVDAYFVPLQSEVTPDIEERRKKLPAKQGLQPIENVSPHSTRRLDEELLNDDASVRTDDRTNDTIIEPEMVKKLNQTLSSAPSDDSAEYVDDGRNLNMRLAEELLFQGSSMAQIGSKEQRKHPQLPHNEHANTASEIEEVINGATRWLDEEIGGEIGEITTENGSGFDAKVYNVRANDEQVPMHSRSTVEDKSREIIFENEEPSIEPGASSAQEPSIYSTLISRLQPTPQFNDRRDHHPVAPLQYHQQIVQGSPLGTEFTESTATVATATSHIPFDTQNPDTAFADVAQSTTKTGEFGKSLQLGINCYLKSLLSKQYYIICT